MSVMIGVRYIFNCIHSLQCTYIFLYIWHCIWEVFYMNAKQVKDLLSNGGYNSLTSKERNEVIKFILRATPISNRESAISLLRGGMIKSVYKQFLLTVERKFNPSQKRMIEMALEPVYGLVSQKNKNGGEIKEESQKCDSEMHIEAFKRMPQNVRRAHMRQLKAHNPKLYKELSMEINLHRKYKGGVKPHFNQNLNNGLGHIKVKDEDGNEIYY